MKYIAIISIIFSGYGFWQWLNRPEADLAPVDLKCTEIAVKNVKVEKINMQMSAPLKKVATSSAQTRSPEIENRDSKMNEVMEEVAEEVVVAAESAQQQFLQHAQQNKSLTLSTNSTKSKLA